MIKVAKKSVITDKNGGGVECDYLYKLFAKEQFYE
jgi:hypothetical protein